MAGRKRCAFCRRDDQKISKEHAFPTWMLACLPNPFTSRQIYNAQVQRDYELNQWRSTETFGTTVNDVCKRCNEGRMNDLEELATPILCPLIGGRSATLTPEQAFIIAAWAYRTALVLDLRHPQNARSIPPMTRRAFYEAPMAPLPGLAVWCASYSGALIGTAVTHFPGSMRLQNGYSLNFSRATFSVGRIVFQLVIYDSHYSPSPGIWVPHLPVVARRSLVVLALD